MADIVVRMREMADEIGNATLILAGREARTELAAFCTEAAAEIEHLRASLSRAEEAEERVARVKQWAEAYPQDIFLPVTPDDLKRADALLREAGISMSAMHGHWARHIVSGIAKIVGADIAGGSSAEETKP